MNEKQTETSKLLNNFRRECLKNDTSFTAKEFRNAAVFGGLTTDNLKWLLAVLVERGFVVQEGTRKQTTYTWKRLYKNESRLEEYDAINPNSWEIVFKRLTTKRSETKRKYMLNKVVAPVITAASAIAFLKEHCPNICITETFECADGTTYTKQY